MIIFDILNSEQNEEPNGFTVIFLFKNIFILFLFWTFLTENY